MDYVVEVFVPETNEVLFSITKKYYDQLVDDSDFLSALEDAGVDNWEWYDEAKQNYLAEKEPE